MYLLKEYHQKHTSEQVNLKKKKTEKLDIHEMFRAGKATNYQLQKCLKRKEGFKGQVSEF